MVLFIWSISSKTHLTWHMTCSHTHHQHVMWTSHVNGLTWWYHLLTYTLLHESCSHDLFLQVGTLVVVPWFICSDRGCLDSFLWAQYVFGSITIYNSNSFVWKFYQSYFNIVLIHIGSCNFSERVIAHQQIWFDIPKMPKLMLSHVPININKEKNHYFSSLFYMAIIGQPIHP